MNDIDAADLIAIGGIATILWLAVDYVAPFFRITLENFPQLLNAHRSVATACASVFPDATVRLELRGGNNIRLYIYKKDFEKIPYPDRDSVVARIGHAWCENVNQIFLPGVSIHDIQTGEELSSYSCVGGPIRAFFHVS